LVGNGSRIQRGLGVRDGPRGGIEQHVEVPYDRHRADYGAERAAEETSRSKSSARPEMLLAIQFKVRSVGHRVMIAGNAPGGLLEDERWITERQRGGTAAAPPCDARRGFE
jgi:hypothetical protein